MTFETAPHLFKQNEETNPTIPKVLIDQKRSILTGEALATFDAKLVTIDEQYKNGEERIEIADSVRRPAMLAEINQKYQSQIRALCQ